jgi:hypothetical protein
LQRLQQEPVLPGSWQSWWTSRGQRGWTTATRKSKWTSRTWWTGTGCPYIQHRSKKIKTSQDQFQENVCLSMVCPKYSHHPKTGFLNGLFVSSSQMVQFSNGRPSCFRLLG